MTLEEARKQLTIAALGYANDITTAEKLRALCAAASEYHTTRMAAASGATAQKNQPKDDPIAPFGRSKGKPLSVIPRSDLEWLAGALEESIANPEKSRWVEANQLQLEVVKAELARRPA